ncbi:GNAT family N-acetyltransferase [Phytomonospora sp. NPDC050363]|uniref:GNAT family N-acetyltransferase n=1 Tax=Phytomonospora sp. NPDC050363 TaxID=3155642 RepID=UPI0033C1A447
MDLDYELVEGVPTVEEYRHLRGSTGLGAKSVEASALGLPNTWFGVLVRREGEAVGMGRIIGDGGCFFQVVDICVLPGHQGRGLGKRVMAALSEAMEAGMPEGAYVSLIADGEARHLYEKFGFREVAPVSVGMARLFL